MLHTREFNFDAESPDLTEAETQALAESTARRLCELEGLEFVHVRDVKPVRADVLVVGESGGVLDTSDIYIGFATCVFKGRLPHIAVVVAE